ncbi:ankyrin repeat domain-containing protein [Sphingobium phenoxybenzoativorans]|uniref:ankyrin repeat domain-containing protein n=1 Tax=Sphingobium phenoxybenzoativorans TaxID=1592790 RepID=UPI00209AE69B|nr:ankyrin repeat domain-containing protein [Sphingobium phenoxybenzoativorans]
MPSPMPEHDEPVTGGPRPLPSPERLQELLFDAARLGRADMIPALVSAGIDLEAHDPKGYTALILASYHGSLETTQALLEAGAQVDAPDLGRGNTALMGVAFKGFGAVARLLLAAGAEPNRRNRAGQTALMMAAMFSHAQIVEDLITAGADIDWTDAAGNSAKSLACTQGNAAMAMLLEVASPSINLFNG